MTRTRRPWRLQSDSLQIESDGRDAFDELLLCNRDGYGTVHLEMVSPRTLLVIVSRPSVPGGDEVRLSIDIETGRVVVVDGSAHGIGQKRVRK